MKKHMQLHVVTVVLAITLLGMGFVSAATAASAKEIDIRVDATLERFYEEIGGGKAFVESSEGVLVFPNVVKAGFVVGGEYGEGALRVDNKTVQYYSTSAGSLGLQIGAQSKAIILVFLDKAALADFRRSAGWEAGVDGSVTLINIGAAGTIDTTNVKDPIVGFVLTNKGLMFDVSLEGSKFTKIVR